MSIHFILMILGDFLVIVVTGFYMGVGIWESAAAQHILGMIVPTLVVWLAASLIFRLYADLPKSIRSVRWNELKAFVGDLIKIQKPRQLFFVWLITCIFQTLWISFYWRGIIHSQRYYYGFSLRTVTWYFSTYAIFFLFWRIMWTGFNTFIALARSYKWVRITGIVLQVLVLIYAVLVYAICRHYEPRKFTVDTLPADAPRTAIVFGAGVYPDGRPSIILADRVNTAIELYNRGLIDEMIMSGDNRDRSFNETDRMAEMALAAGVSESAIIRDNEGLHSVDSVDNAKILYGKDEVIFISQDFHNVRILMIADKYNVGGVAVAADRSSYNLFTYGALYLLDWIRTPMYWAYYEYDWLP